MLPYSILAFDIGNTSTKVGVFEAGVLKKPFKTKSAGLTLKSYKEYVRKYDAKFSIVSSTRHLQPALSRFIADNDQSFVLNHLLALPFEVVYQTPKTLGADRLAGIAGSLHYYPKGNNLVIDAGTCITYDMVTKDKIYVGGNISPGVHLRLKAMHHYTDALPLIKRFGDAEAHGTSTTTALKAGAGWGAVHEINGFVSAYKKQFGRVNIVLTGGDAPFFDNRLKTKIFVAPNLVLEGLRKLLEYNVEGID